MHAIDFYSKVAQEFHASYTHDPNRLERIQVWNRFLDRYLNKAELAYDLGCGSGILACELGKRGTDTIAIDGSPQMLAIAKNMAQERGLANVTFTRQHLPIKDTSHLPPADIIIASSILEYLDSISASLQFFSALLKEKGIVIFSISNRDSLSRKVVRLIHRLTGKPEYFGYVRHFMTTKDIESEIANRFEFLEYEYFGGSDRLNRFISCFLPAKFSSNMIMVAARKKDTK